MYGQMGNSIFAITRRWCCYFQLKKQIKFNEQGKAYFFSKIMVVFFICRQPIWLLKAIYKLGRGQAIRNSNKNEHDENDLTVRCV